jgi:hypothetical protein
MDVYPIGVQEGRSIWGSQKKRCCQLSTIELKRLFVWLALHAARVGRTAKTFVFCFRWHQNIYGSLRSIVTLKGNVSGLFLFQVNGFRRECTCSIQMQVFG